MAVRLNDPDPGLPRSPLRSRGTLRRVGLSTGLVVLLLLCLGISGVLPVRVVRVASDSMVPALSAGDLVVVVPTREVARRDVVAVTRPGGDDLIVKRAVAVGGDRVAIEDGVLTVDGTPACEPAIDPDRIDGVWFAPVTVPDGELFLLGDDRRDAVDSRDFGTVPASDVVGVVHSRLWPSPGGLAGTPC